jgi:hypothetical protein
VPEIFDKVVLLEELGDLPAYPTDGTTIIPEYD